MKYFGTDGIRQEAAEFFRGDFTYRLGRALRGLKTEAKLVVVGRDTRLSGAAIEDALTLGLIQSGLEVLEAGIVPTPAVAYLTKLHGADFGIVISASHNPPQYNGIKIFGGDGYKLPDEKQALLETLIDGNFDIRAQGGGITKIGREEYVDYAVKFVDADFSGIDVKLDCGYGAASFIAAEIFEKLGAKTERICEGYEGALINVSSGSTHMENLDVNGAFIGFSFDGDADRVLAKNRKGEVLDGDVFLLLLSQYYKKTGRLAGNAAVGTVLSNSALENSLKRSGIGFERTAVGDIYVQQKMLEANYSLGAEQSGHVILDGFVRTGDGIIAAAMLLKAINELGVDPEKISEIYRPYPQYCIDISATAEEKRVIESPEAKNTKEACEARLDGDGFIVLRASGTEPKIRVAVQAAEAKLAESLATKIANAVKKEISALKSGGYGAE